MVNQNSKILSESEEMYLLTIEKLSARFDGGMVPLSEMAEALSIQPVSANQMIHKLDEEGLVEYQPYKGVKLSPSGQRHTQGVLRDRRIWKTFLNQKLGVPIRKADDLACRFEHITPEEVIARLYEYLGKPTHTPEGEPIPNPEETLKQAPQIPLTNIAAGQRVEIGNIQAKGAAIEFLETEGIHLGAPITVLASGGNGAVLVESNETRVSLSAEIARSIMVTYIPSQGGSDAHA